MNKEELINVLKAQYNKDIREQLVHALMEAEEQEASEKQQKLMNQIFSYVLSELGWTMVSSTKEWDDSPLEVMKEVFPKIKKTKWYQEQKLSVKKEIAVEQGEIN